MKMIVLSMLRQAFCISTIFDTMKIKLSHEFNFSLLFGIKVSTLDLEINLEKMQNMHAYYMNYNIMLYVKPCHGHVTSKFYHHAKSFRKSPSNNCKYTRIEGRTCIEKGRKFYLKSLGMCIYKT